MRGDWEIDCMYVENIPTSGNTVRSENPVYFSTSHSARESGMEHN